MASENVYDWSSVASNNGSVDSGINAQEGQLPSTVNNALRGIMSALARFMADTGANFSASGTASAYTASIRGTFSTLATGQRLRLKAPIGNSGGATLAVTNAAGSALGAKQIRKFTPTGETSLAVSNIVGSGIYDLMYDAAASGGSGAWIVMNPTRVLSEVITSSTGTGSVVLASGPTLIAPILGAASATTYNNVTIPAPNSTAILAMANSVQLSVVSSTIIGRGQYLATNTNDAASAGNLGEIVSVIVPIASVIALTHTAAKNVASVTLGPGTWKVWGDIGFTGSGTTNVTILRAMISPVSDTAETTIGRIGNVVPGGAAGATVFAQDFQIVQVGPFPVALAASTTYNLVAQAFFSVSSCGAFGAFYAQRPR